MPANPFRNKVALIFGADTPVGRSAALQFSRSGSKTILAGHEEKKLILLMNLILDKKGDPAAAVLPSNHEKALELLTTREAEIGKVHFIFNAGGTILESPETSLKAYEKLGLELIPNRKNIKWVTVWPDKAGDLPEPPEGIWHSFLRLNGVSHEVSEVDEGRDGLIRPGAIADAGLAMLNCPGGACPIEVRLESR